MREWTTSGASSASRRAMTPRRGVADDVGALDAEVLQQGAAIGGLLAETERRSDRAAAGVAAPVVAHQAVAAVQRRLAAERRVCLGDQGTVDQQDRFAGARDFELEFRSVDARPLHGFAPLFSRCFYVFLFWFGGYLGILACSVGREREGGEREERSPNPRGLVA